MKPEISQQNASEILVALSLQEEKEKKASNQKGVPVNGSLPIIEISLLHQVQQVNKETKLVEKVEPTRFGEDKLTPKSFSEPLYQDVAIPDNKDRAYLRSTDCNQGRNGNCWFVASFGALLSLPEGDHFLSSCMRDLSQKVSVIYDQRDRKYILSTPEDLSNPKIEKEEITLGRLCGLPDDSILIRFQKDGQPKYVTVDKSTIEGNFPIQGANYIKILEKAYIGLYLDGDYENAWASKAAAKDRDYPINMEDVFSALTDGRTIYSRTTLDVSDSRKEHTKKFSDALSSKLFSSEINEILDGNKDLIAVYKTLKTKAQEYIKEEKLESSSEKIIALMSRAANESPDRNRKNAEEVISRLLNRLQILNSENKYHKMFAAKLFALFADASASPFTEIKTEKLQKMRPIIIGFDPEKIIASNKGRSNEPISEDGLIGTHAFYLSHVGKLMASAPGQRSFFTGGKVYDVVNIVNPWGERGTAVLLDEKGGLTRIKCDNNMSSITVDDLLKWGKEICECSFSPTIQSATEVSKNSLAFLSQQVPQEPEFASESESGSGSEPESPQDQAQESIGTPTTPTTSITSFPIIFQPGRTSNLTSSTSENSSGVALGTGTTVS